MLKYFFISVQRKAELMPPKKTPEKNTLPPSPFITADRLLKKESGKTENQKRFDWWADRMVRERRIGPGWKDDREALEKIALIKKRAARAAPDEPNKN